MLNIALRSKVKCNVVAEEVYQALSSSNFSIVNENGEKVFSIIERKPDLYSESHFLRLFENLGYLIYKRNAISRSDRHKENESINTQYFSKEFVSTVQKISRYSTLLHFDLNNIGVLRNKAFSPFVTAVLFELQTLEQKKAFSDNTKALVGVPVIEPEEGNILSANRYFELFIIRVSNRFKVDNGKRIRSFSRSINDAITGCYQYVEYLVLKYGDLYCVGTRLPIMMPICGPFTKKNLLKEMRAKLIHLLNNCRQNENVFDGYVGHIASINTQCGQIPCCDLLMFFNKPISIKFKSIQTYDYWMQNICKVVDEKYHFYETPENILQRQIHFIEMGNGPKNILNFVSSIIPVLTGGIVINDLYTANFICVTHGRKVP